MEGNLGEPGKRPGTGYVDTTTVDNVRFMRDRRPGDSAAARTSGSRPRSAFSLPPSD